MELDHEDLYKLAVVIRTAIWAKENTALRDLFKTSKDKPRKATSDLIARLAMMGRGGE